MIIISKNCDTCVHDISRDNCQKYCNSFSNHEFKCDYCDYKLPDNNKRFCEQENNDGSQNCCGDHFEFNHSKYKIMIDKK